jgi:hypothetical protein
MKIAYLGIGLLIVSACGRPRPTSDMSASGIPAPAISGSSDTAEPDMLTWHDRNDMPRLVEPARVPFAGPDMRRRFLRADQLARALAGSDWAQQTGPAYPFYQAGYGSQYSRTYNARWEKLGSKERAQARANHLVEIQVTLEETPQEAKFFRLAAQCDVRGGWTANLSYMSGPFGDGLSLLFWHPQMLPYVPGGTEGITGFGVGGPWFSASRRGQKYGYRFLVKRSGGGKRVTSEENIPYLRSAESFRGRLCANLDHLAECGRKDLRSDKSGEVWTLGGPTGRDVP